VEVFTNVSYARDAVEDWMIDEVVYRSKEAVRAAVARSLEVLTRRYFKGAA
jgi:hypothetical protein